MLLSASQVGKIAVGIPLKKAKAKPGHIKTYQSPELKWFLPLNPSLAENLPAWVGCRKIIRPKSIKFCQKASRWNLWASYVKKQQVLRPWQCQSEHHYANLLSNTLYSPANLRISFTYLHRFAIIPWCCNRSNRFNRAGQRQAASHHDGKCHSGACDLRPAIYTVVARNRPGTKNIGWSGKKECAKWIVIPVVSFAQWSEIRDSKLQPNDPKCI